MHACQKVARGITALSCAKRCWTGELRLPAGRLDCSFAVFRNLGLWSIRSGFLHTKTQIFLGETIPKENICCGSHESQPSKSG